MCSPKDCLGEEDRGVSAPEARHHGLAACWHIPQELVTLPRSHSGLDGERVN